MYHYDFNKRVVNGEQLPKIFELFFNNYWKSKDRRHIVRLPFERIDHRGRETALAFFLHDAVTSLASAQAGIEQISRGVSENVETVDDHRQEKPGPECQPGGLLHQLVPLAAEIPSQLGRSALQPDEEIRKPTPSLGLIDFGWCLCGVAHDPVFSLIHTEPWDPNRDRSGR